jgi:hypothetical protein
MIRLRRIIKTGRLLHISAFIKIAMKKSIDDVNLMNIPAVRHDYREDKPNICRPNNGAESLHGINAKLLNETPSNQSSLQLVH